MATEGALPRRILLDGLFLVLAIQCLYLLWPFLSPICWALILAYLTWPLYRRGRESLGRFAAMGPPVMTLLVSCAVILPVLWLLVLFQEEFLRACKVLANDLARGPHTLPAALHDIPWIGQRLQEELDRYTADPTALGRQLGAWLQRGAGYLPGLLGTIGGTLGRLAVTLVALYVFYRDGDALVRQARRVATRLVGERLDPYVQAAGVMTRAVLFGFVVTVFAQGMVAGLGYFLAGVEAPVFLGALTGLLSVIPVLGTALVWVPIAISLLLADHLWRGVFLLAWGALLVHPTDNILRPLLISNAAKVPFLLIMLGALGGLAAYGLIGVFIGPVLLGAAAAIWREWAND